MQGLGFVSCSWSVPDTVNRLLQISLPWGVHLNWQNPNTMDIIVTLAPSPNDVHQWEAVFSPRRGSLGASLYKNTGQSIPALGGFTIQLERTKRGLGETCSGEELNRAAS